MKTTVAKYAGFCFGVKRAVDFVFSLAESEREADIYTVGELIHNADVLGRLAERGVHAVSAAQAEEIIAAKPERKTVFIIRAHGITLPLMEKLRAAEENENISVYDYTCPYVRKIHDIADENTAGENTAALLFGDKNHPEVQGIASHIGCPHIIFSSCEELASPENTDFLIKYRDFRLIMMAQTTQNFSEYKKCQKFIKNLCTNPIIFDTICSVTENRQKEAEILSRECDVVLVCGSMNSANTRKLYEISKKNCPRTLLIGGAADIPPDYVHDSDRVGIAAGASTPGYIIEEVQKTMSEQTNFAQLLEESFKSLNTGDTVTGIVTSVSATEVQLDLGCKVTGVLTLANVTDDPQAKLADLFKVGDTVEAVAVRVNDVEGIATLSKKKVDAKNNWNLVAKALEDGEVLSGKVIEAVKGGVVISALSQKIFVPASQTGVARDGDLSALVGTTQKFKIIEIKEDRRRAVGSIKAVQREERKAAKEAFWANIEEGKHYKGVVKSLTSYGAFVDLGGVDGMVHNSELSWTRISNPKDVVSIGQEIDVYVKSFDAEKGRVSLGYKTEESNPWTIFMNNYKVGDVVKVTVVSMTPFGAFAQIIPGVDGLIHISQIADKKLAHPSDVLKKGEEVEAKIIDINEEAHNVSLSIRALLEKDEDTAEEAPAEVAEATAEETAEAAEATAETAE